MLAGDTIMTDKEVAEYLGVCPRTLTRHLRKPKRGQVDLNAVKPVTFAGRRFWVKADIDQLFGINRKGAPGRVGMMPTASRAHGGKARAMGMQA